MSRHITIMTAKLEDGTTAPVRISIGWDRPLQGYVLDVENLSKDFGDSERVLYTNLNESPEGSHPATLGPFLSRLAQLGIELPERMRSELQADRINDAGNRVLQYAMEA